MRETTDIEIADDGWETHPSFGWAYVNNVSVSPPGVSLFDSELHHQHAVVLRIGRARRKRELNRDWLMEDGVGIVEVYMSKAQWGALVSSFGSSGVPCTLHYVDGERLPEAPHAPRMEVSVREVEDATDKLLEQVRSAVEELRAAHDNKAGRKEVAEKLRTLEIRLGNARANARYAAETFTEHVENVVTKARADIEAMVATAAAHQIEAGVVAGALGVGSGERW